MSSFFLVTENFFYINYLSCIFFSTFFKFSDFINHNKKKNKQFVFSKYNFTSDNFIKKIISFNNHIFRISHISNTEKRFKYINEDNNFNIYFYSTARFYFRFNGNKNINFLMKKHNNKNYYNHSLNNQFLPVKYYKNICRYKINNEKLLNFPYKILRHKTLNQIFFLFYYFSEKNNIFNCNNKYFQMKYDKLNVYLNLLYDIFKILGISYKKFSYDLSKHNLYILLYLKTIIKNFIFQVILSLKNELIIAPIQNDIFYLKNCFILKNNIIKRSIYIKKYDLIRNIFDKQIKFVNLNIICNKNSYDLYHIYYIDKKFQKIYFTSFAKNFFISCKKNIFEPNRTLHTFENILNLIK